MGVLGYLRGDDSLRGSHVPGVVPPSPVPLSLTASAARLTADTVKSLVRRGSASEAWQDDAWGMWDAVGELWFITNTIASQAAKARFYIGYLNDDPNEPPTPIRDPATAGLLDRLGPPAYRAQMVQRAVNGFLVVGEAYLIGVPSDLLVKTGKTGKDLRNGMADPDGIEWRVVSSSEVTSAIDGILTLRLSDTDAVELPDDETVDLIRMWTPHPRYHWLAASPTRSSLPVLRELVGLTMHVSAQVDSRLAGAGLLVVPQSVQNAARKQAGLPNGPTVVDGVVKDDDTFTDSLIAAMTTPINERGAASAVVPLVVTVPDDVAIKGTVQHIGFATPLDAEARQLRDEAIRRLALGMSAPPEVLLGVGATTNHWSAWAVQADNIGTHVEPHDALWCDALTVQWLRPLLDRADELGLDPRDNDGNVIDPSRIVVWYDVSHMVIEPNRVSDATALYDRGVISDDALRDAAGYGEGDATREDDLPRAASLAFEMITKTPSLAASPGLGALVQQIQAVLDGDYAAASAVVPQGTAEDVDTTDTAEDAPSESVGTIPSTQGDAP